MFLLLCISFIHLVLALPVWKYCLPVFSTMYCIFNQVTRQHGIYGWEYCTWLKIQVQYFQPGKTATQDTWLKLLYLHFQPVILCWRVTWLKILCTCFSFLFLLLSSEGEVFCIPFKFYYLCFSLCISWCSRFGIGLPCYLLKSTCLFLFSLSFFFSFVCVLYHNTDCFSFLFSCGNSSTFYTGSTSTCNSLFLNI